MYTVSAYIWEQRNATGYLILLRRELQNSQQWSVGVQFEGRGSAHSNKSYKPELPQEDSVFVGIESKLRFVVRDNKDIKREGLGKNEGRNKCAKSEEENCHIYKITWKQKKRDLYEVQKTV